MPTSFSYVVFTSGNSTGSVSLALQRRGWEKLDGAFAAAQPFFPGNFVWKPTWAGTKPAPATLQFARGHPLPGKRQIFNHWRAVEPLCTKDGFFATMSEYYAAVGRPAGERLPPTFIVAPTLSRDPAEWPGWCEFEAALRECERRGQRLWLAKPTDENRGLGIEVCRSRAEVAEFLASKGRAASIGVKPHWVLQKYLEDPLLSPDGRKFDLRVWVVVADTGDVAVHAPGCACNAAARPQQPPPRAPKTRAP